MLQIARKERFQLRFEVKVPGFGLRGADVDMQLDCADHFEAWGPLLVDALRGDQTLFEHRVEVEGAWNASRPLLDERSASVRARLRANYACGSWGPATAEELLARGGRAWRNESRLEGTGPRRGRLLRSLLGGRATMSNTRWRSHSAALATMALLCGATEARSDVLATPSREQVLTAMNSVRAAVQSCGGGVVGTVTVSITFSSQGRVIHVAASGAPTVTPGVGPCIEAAVRTAQVPAFQSASFSVNYPFVLR